MVKKKFWITFIICTVIFIAALASLTSFDLSISNSFYQKGILVNKVLEVIGPAFMPFFVIYAVTSLICLLKFKKRFYQIFTYIGLGFAYFYAFFMGCMTFRHSYCPALFIPSIILYLLFTGLMVFLNLKVFKKKEDYLVHIKICLVMLIVTMTSLILTDILKIFFSRVRYFEVLEGQPYNPWYYLTWRWNINSSFPSGHVSRAGTTLCFALLLYYKKTKSIYIYAIELLATIFTIWVSLSRVVEGMHYATDILTAFYLINVSYFISKYLLLTKK